MKRSPSRLALAFALALALAAPGCAGSPAAELAQPPTWEPPGQTKCTAVANRLRPLIVEWPSADRLDLEARIRRGAVAVRYVGCRMEVLHGCSVPGQYRYAPTTRQEESVKIRDEAGLYANIPVYAAKFEGVLERTGELNVRISMVGRYEATQPSVRLGDLTGDECARATHVVTALTAGAFDFYAGAEAATGAGVDIAGFGADARSSAVRENLNRAGKHEACDRATNADRAPPDGCGALLRLEVAPVAGAIQVAQPGPAGAPVARAPARAPVQTWCGVGQVWDGLRCTAAEALCPAGMKWESDETCRPLPTPYEAQLALDKNKGCPPGTRIDPKTLTCRADGGSACPPARGTRRGAAAWPARRRRRPRRPRRSARPAWWASPAARSPSATTPGR